MKTELRARPHEVLLGQTIFEIWHGGQFIATVAGADSPGVRVISKHPLTPTLTPGLLNVVEIAIKPAA